MRRVFRGIRVAGEWVFYGLLKLTGLIRYPFSAVLVPLLEDDETKKVRKSQQWRPSSFKTVFGDVDADSES